jgi:hypothetical protein
MPAKPSSDKQTTHEPKSDLAVSYNKFKEYEGQRYTGMKIGRSHKWYYDEGEMEGNQDHARPVADRLRRDQATCGTRSRGLRCPGRDRIPLVRTRPSKRRQAERERLHHVAHRTQVQDRPQARGQRQVERDAEDAAQAHDPVLARRHRRPREAEREGGIGTHQRPARDWHRASDRAGRGASPLSEAGAGVLRASGLPPPARSAPPCCFARPQSFARSGCGRVSARLMCAPASRRRPRIATGWCREQPVALGPPELLVVG